MGLVERLSDALGLRGEEAPAQIPVQRISFAGSGDPVTLLVRSDPSGIVLVSVDGRFLMRLGLDGAEIPGLVAAGTPEDEIVQAVRARNQSSSAQAILNAVQRVKKVLQAIDLGDESSIRREVVEGITRSDLRLGLPARADVLLTSLDGAQKLEHAHAQAILTSLARAGILDVRLVATGDLAGTDARQIARTAREAGLVTGVIAAARRFSNIETAESLARAGVSYLDMTMGGTDRDIDYALAAAQVEGIEVLSSVCISHGQIERACESILKLAAGGVVGIAVTALVEKSDDPPDDGVTLSHERYEEALKIIRAKTASIDCVLLDRSPLIISSATIDSPEGVRARCTASDNAPAVSPDGAIRPCLHSRHILGYAGKLEGPGTLPAPIRTITDAEGSAVNVGKLCLGCLS